MRNHIYHVYTPFSRFQNIVIFTRLLQPLGVQWHPIFDEELGFRIEPSDWVHPLYCPAKVKGWELHMGHYRGNFFFEHAEIVPEDRYMNINDDDMVEPDFFEKIDQHEGDAIICTALRGHHQPPTGPQYGTATLEAKAECLKPGLVSGEQLIFTGRILGTDRYDQDPCGDGRFIQRITNRVKPDFAPEANLWFNYLEPGRWDNAPKL